MSSRVVVVAVLSGAAIAAALGIYIVSTRPEPEPAEAAPARPVARRATPPPVPSRELAPSRDREAPRRVPPPPANAAVAAPEAPAVETAPTTATLRIDSDVPGAEVFLDRTFLGVTPITVPNVTPGSHRLNLTATGHEGIAETIEVVPGPRDITVAFRTIRLDARISVVHKHAFGSCAGTLSATADGLRYETTHKDDAFSVALTGFDNFAVDYPGKTLKLKVKNGKSFTFMDAEGNADRLFVFHRDVEKARARLAKGP